MSAIGSSKGRHRNAAAGAEATDRAPEAGSPAGTRRRRLVGSLTARVLAINILALAILAGGFLYLDRYQGELLAIKADGLVREGRLIASAIAGQVEADAEAPRKLESWWIEEALQRLSVPAGRRIRLFAADGHLLADSEALPGAALQTRDLPPPENIGAVTRAAYAVYDWVLDNLPPRRRGPPLPMPDQPTADKFPLAAEALAGSTQYAIFEAPGRGRVVLVTLPLQSVKRVHGALLITASADDVDHSVRDVRFALVLAFVTALAITVLLSLYLAGTITGPVRKLAEAADAIRQGRGRKVDVPDFTARHDEIGGLSASLTAMTDALWSRMDAIENFVADVAHEIKNPLTSLRSAVETARRVDDEEQRNKLLDIIATDVNRLDRLLSEIADASRIDTELARAEPEAVDLVPMLETIVDIYRAQRISEGGVEIRFAAEADGRTRAVPERMAQVFRNLIDNAVSFAPPGSAVDVRLSRCNGWIEITVEDQGPGVPEDARERIFERFYTDRPEPTPFGTHSGLGLAISRQIVESHRGRISCENRHDTSGAVSGARFTVLLPASNTAAPGRNP